MPRTFKKRIETVQTTDFTCTHNGVAVTLSIPTSLFQRACSSSQWPNVPVEDNQRSLAGLITDSLQVLSNALASMFDTVRYVAIQHLALQEFLTEYRRQWLEESLPILNDEAAELSPTLNNAMFLYQRYVLENKPAEERLQKGTAAVFAGQTTNFTGTTNGTTVIIKVPTSSFQQVCFASQWPYMPVEDTGQLLWELYTETVRLLAESFANMLAIPQYVAIANICLQAFLTNLGNQWLERWLPALKESDRGAALAPILTDALCWYMIYELKKDATVEARFHAYNPNALAVLRFRAFGQPVLEHEPPIVLGNRPN